jgi:hypothetical protein
MSNTLNDQSQQVLKLAADEARRFQHSYVGTEHLLLGLMLEGSCQAHGTLARLGVSVDNVRAEIEKLVCRGTAPVADVEIPLTPRARRVVQFAYEEAAIVNQTLAGPEHLLIGLIREPEGVAGQVMRNLGLSLRRVWEESLKVRLSLIWLGWRPGESGLRWMTRSAFASFGILAVGLGIPHVAGVIIQGWDQTQVQALRTIVAMVVLIPATQFTIGLMYLKLRAALFGFGTRRPMLKGFGWALGIALSVFAAGIAFISYVQWPMGPENGLPLVAIVGILAALACLIRVRLLAMTEWRDTLWGTLQLDASV